MQKKQRSERLFWYGVGMYEGFTNDTSRHAEAAKEIAVGHMWVLKTVGQNRFEACPHNGPISAFACPHKAAAYLKRHGDIMHPVKSSTPDEL